MSRRSTKQRRAAQRRRVDWSRWREQHGDYAHVWASGAWWWDRLVKRCFEAPIVDTVQRENATLRRWDW